MIRFCGLATTALAMMAGQFALNAALADDTVITTHTKGAHSTYRVQIPLSVYSGAAHADLSDLRVVNGADEVLPFAFLDLPPRPVAHETSAALPAFPLPQTDAAPPIVTSAIRGYENGNDELIRQSGPTSTARSRSYLLDCRQFVQPIHALDLAWHRQSEGGHYLVTVEASDDLQSWHTLATEAPVLDLQFAGQHLVERRVHFAASKAAYLRLTVNNPVFGLFEVTAHGRAPQELVIEPQRLTVAGEPMRQPSEYRFDLGAKLPVLSARLHLPEPNTLAPTSLFVRHHRTAPWTPVAEATFYRLQSHGVESAASAVAAHTNGEPEWLARMDLRSGGIGQGLPTLEVEWIPHEIAFIARGPAPFRLQYGDPRQRAANLALTTVIPGYQWGDEWKLPEAVPDREVFIQSATVKTPAQSEDDVLLKRIVLWTVLILAVAVLGWMAMRLSRDLQSTPP
jgi:Protein of unknown function (DUF3999)